MNTALDTSGTQKANNSSLLRIAELEKYIARYQKSYYNGEAEVSDEEFDRLWDELTAHDPENPLLKKIGADSGSFAKARHIIPMGSQDKAADPEQFLAWAKKRDYPEYLVEFKLDGASLELQYERGKLLRAVTRGDGTVGDDITANAKKFSGVLETLFCDGNPVDFSGGIRGEVIMTHETHRTKFSDKANCRNAANGLMKRKDGEGSENLTLIVYDALSSSGETFFSNEKEKIDWLKKLGFNTAPLFVCKTAEDVIDCRARIMESRKSLDYDIDGLVIKENEIHLEDLRRARPERQIAFKFSLEEAVSVLRGVEWSKSGATYTPVGLFDEVPLNGTIVKRASFSNPSIMRKLGVKIGCKIIVVKRGEIIPKIESAFHEDGTEEKEIAFPSECETCGSPLVDDDTRLFCPNKNCPKRTLHRLLKWAEAADIRDMGEALIVSLFQSGKVTRITDFYTLTEADLTPFFLNEESRAQEKKSLGAEKVIKSVNDRRNMTLSSFVAGFDIEGIGETSVEKLVEAGFASLEKLLAMSVEEAASVYGFAEITARIAVEGLAENAEEMRDLASNYISIQEVTAGTFSGKSFCFTGELTSMKRAEAQSLVKSLGGVCRSSVTKDLTYLVTNDAESGSAKNKKALKLGVAVISEKEFLALAGK
ncbi:MAG: NAD-dependent DNA ligase LigA [Treponema sp.]